MTDHQTTPLHEQLRDAVSRQAITQAILAEQTGLTQGALSKILNGQRHRDSIDTLAKIADALGLEIVLRKKRDA